VVTNFQPSQAENVITNGKKTGDNAKSRECTDILQKNFNQLYSRQKRWKNIISFPFRPKFIGLKQSLVFA
jgi:hypothetical protein